MPTALPGLCGPFEGQYWIALAHAPEVRVGAEVYALDAARIAEIVDAFDAFKARGYEPGWTLAHEDEGVRWGQVRQLQSWLDPEDGVQKLMGLCEFPPRAMALIEAGELRYYSPSFGPDPDGTAGGQDRRQALREVSFTIRPLQKGVGSVQYWMRRQGHPFQGAEMSAKKMADQVTAMAEPAPAPEDPMSKMAEQVKAMADVLASVQASVTAMAERMDRVEAMVKPAEESAEEPAAQEPEVDASAKKLEEVERRLAQIEASARAQRLRAELGLGAEKVQELLELAGGDEARARKIAALLPKAAAANPLEGAAVPSVEASASGKPSAEEVYKLAEAEAKKGGTHADHYSRLMRQHGHWA
jgi:hypothetical protein